MNSMQMNWRRFLTTHPVPDLTLQNVYCCRITGVHLSCCLAVYFVLFSLSSGAQVVQPATQTNGSRSSNVITAVPFLLITPDARTAGMGEAGVAVEPDVNSISNNPAKLSFLIPDKGISASYSPWLRSLLPDVNLGFVSGYYKPDASTAIGMSMRYFSLGKVELNDPAYQQLGVYRPSELAVDFTYARRFGDAFSLGTAVRYIYSNLLAGQVIPGQSTSGGKAFAADVSAYYIKKAQLFGRDARFSSGLDISNLGTKMRYGSESRSYFLPANLRIGASAMLMIDDDNQLTLAMDLNKLLVPTEPLYDGDGNIIAGRSSERSIPSAIFGSFTDAPGGGKEELQEISIASGLEYVFRQQFALRIGYFYENPNKGNRRYATLGSGIKYNAFNFDFAYIPGSIQRNPLANTLRFSIMYNFDYSL